jgi:hypothetical protein
MGTPPIAAANDNAARAAAPAAGWIPIVGEVGAAGRVRLYPPIDAAPFPNDPREA